MLLSAWWLTIDWIAIATFVVGLIVKGVRLESRVDAQARELTSLRDDYTDGLLRLREDITYIRTRVDGLTDRRGAR